MDKCFRARRSHGSFPASAFGFLSAFGFRTSDFGFIRIGFTDQKVSGRAGLLTFAGFPHWHRLGALQARVLPHQRVSHKAIPVADLALGFLGSSGKYLRFPGGLGSLPGL